jgi:hypothetical protein
MSVIERDFPVELKTNRRPSQTTMFSIPSGKTWKILKITFLETAFPEFSLQLSVNNSLQPAILATTISQGSFPVANFGFAINAGSSAHLVATPTDHLDSPAIVTIQLAILEE